MNRIIVSEHFTLRPAEQADIQKYLDKLECFLPEDGSVRIFLTLDKGNHYRALFKAHFGNEDLVAEESAYDLHKAVSSAADSLRRRIASRKSKATHLRRRHYETA